MIIGGYPQEVYTRFDMHNFNHNYFAEDDREEEDYEAGNSISEDDAKRELVDWLSPGWFETAVGAPILDIETVPSGKWSYVYVRADSAVNFIHRCWGNDDDSTCFKKYDIRGYTYVMAFPEDMGDMEGMVLADCKDDPKYEIMKLDSIGIVDDTTAVLRVRRGMWNTHPLETVAGMELRPLIWSNPNNWGSTAFFMNVTDFAPRVYLVDESHGLFSLADVAATLMEYHHLASYVRVLQTDPYIDTTFYLADGVMMDAYQANGLKDKLVRLKQFLHAQNIDLDLNGIPDCGDFSPGDPLSECDESPDGPAVMESWREGYKHFLQQVREKVVSVRGTDSTFIILPNGHPDSTQWKYVNGRHFEDVNGHFQESNLREVIDHTRDYYYGDFSDPRRIQYFERDRNVSYDSGTDLPPIRMTMALSLILSNEGSFGAIGGGYLTRHPLFGDGPEVEDYYDEYAVDELGRGFHNPAFAAAYEADESYLHEHRHYLGDPVVEDPYPDEYAGDPSPRWVRDHPDMLYREFDHGLVIAHLGICGETDYYQVVFDDLVLEDDPRDNTMLCPGGCCFMEIEGGGPPYNDGRNLGVHHRFGIVVDGEGGGDGVILLKEGDGFYYDEDGHNE